MPDAELDFGPDLVMHYQGRPFTGISHETMDDGTRSEAAESESACRVGRRDHRHTADSALPAGHPEIMTTDAKGAITHLIAGVPITRLDVAIDWYTRLFGRPPDLRAGEEVLWDIDEHATLFIEPDAARAGAGRITFAVSQLDGLLARLAGEGIGHEAIETYSNGVRHVKVPDPDGNAIAFAELPS